MKTLQAPEICLPEVVASHAKWRPDAEALVCDGRRVTWAELNRRVNRVANALIARGVRRGDKIAALLGNGIETVEIILGAVKAGGVIVPLSGLVPGEGLAMMIEDSDARALFVAAPSHAAIAPLRPHLAGVRPEAFVALGFDAEGWTPFDGLMAAASDAEPTVQPTLADDFNIIYSSGTTGVPKGIVHTHAARVFFAFGLATEFRFTPQSRALITTPLYANGTWMMMLPSLLVAGTLVIMPQFNPRAFLDLVQTERCTHTFMVPTQFIVTMGLGDFQQYDIRSLQVMVSAGAPLREETKHQILQRFGPGLFELYGLTEGVATTLRPEEMAGKSGSVGRPFLGSDVRIIDDAGHELPRGEIGEIIGYSSGLMRCYYKKPTETAEAIFIDEAGRGHLKTGDVGRLDRDGYLYIVDRKKDVIISGGANVFASDIEAVLQQHPDVADAAVIGVPHDKWGETPLALVIPKPGATPKDAELAEWANARLGKHQRVSGVEFRPSFPRNALGKVLKRELRQPYWKAER